MDKRFLFSFVVLLLMGSFFFVSCANYDEATYRIVTFKGGEFYFNVTKDSFSWFVGNNDNGLSALPLYDGDLLLIEFEDEEHENGGYIYRYSTADGNSLDFSVRHSVLFLHNKPISLRLESDDALLEWLQNAGEDDLTSLRSITLAEDPAPEAFPLIEKIASAQPRLGLFMESGMEEAQKILELFDPSMLIAPDVTFDAAEIAALYRLENLELLYISHETLDPEKIADLKGLTTLLVAGLEQETATAWEQFPANLRALSIIDADIRDVNFLRNSKTLSELNVINCDTLMNVSALSALTQLTVFNATGCDQLTALPALPALRWFSPPSTIAQREFDLFIAAHPGIEVLSCFECSELENLDALQNAAHLACVNIAEMEVALDPLFEMKNMRYLSLPEEVFADTLRIADVRKKLPNTVIVPNTGFCLGSGWILLFLPIALLLGVGAVRRKKSTAGL